MGGKESFHILDQSVGLFWGGKVSFHILDQSVGLFLGEKGEMMFLLQPEEVPLQSSYLGKSPIIFYIQTYTLSTGKGYLTGLRK